MPHGNKRVIGAEMPQCTINWRLWRNRNKTTASAQMASASLYRVSRRKAAGPCYRAKQIKMGIKNRVLGALFNRPHNTNKIYAAI